MRSVPVLVLRTAGINCDEEIVHAWRVAGAEPSLLHLNELTAQPERLNDFAILTIPGGFSYGDDIAAGKILAERIELGMAERLHHFVERGGGGVLGVCNGFQVLVKMGLLPGGKFRDKVSVTNNDSAKFEARWVRLQPTTDRCPFLPKGRSILEMPVEHAEGKVVTAATEVAEELLRGGYVALRYVDEGGRHDTYPANPNGSALGIAGLCDVTGRVFGLMPHPDRFFDVTQHPQWTSRKIAEPADGLAMFQAAVAHWR